MSENEDDDWFTKDIDDFTVSKKTDENPLLTVIPASTLRFIDSGTFS